MWSPAEVNVLSETNKQQVLALGRLGWSLRQIQQTTGVRRETASTYLKQAGIAVRLPRTRSPPKPASQAAVSTDPSGPKPASQAAVSTDPSRSNPARDPPVSTDPSGPNPARDPQVSTDPPTVAQPGRAPSASACEPYRELIEPAMRKGRNAMAIYQDLVSDHGFAHGYASVQRFVRAQHGSKTPQERAVIVTPPGQEAQVDYGEGPMVRDPDTGKYRRTRLFVLTLGFSRKSVRLLCFKSSSAIWAQLHEQAFRRLGGAVRVVVLDNLREGVLRPELYDPQLNPLYRDVLAHYGVAAMPCRVRDPDRKGKVESAVGHAQKTPLKGLRFETLEQAQQYLDRWEQRWADTRIHGTTKKQVAAMFEEERPHLLPLPLTPFRYYQHGVRTVHLDGCVEVEAAYYHAPPGFIGRQVAVQWDGVQVRILDSKTGQLLREYLRQRRGGRIVRPEDLPKRTPVPHIKLLRAAAQVGPSVGALCDRMYQQDAEAAVRRIQGVLSLGRKHGAARLEQGCAYLLQVGLCDYRPLRAYLERTAATPPVPLKQIDPLIRQLTHYRDLVAQRIKEQKAKEDSEDERTRTDAVAAQAGAVGNG